MKQVFLALLFPFLFVKGLAQPYQKTDQGIKAVINAVNVEIQFYRPGMVRIVKSPVGKSFSKKSLSVITGPAKVNFTSRQLGTVVRLQSDRLMVDLDLTSGVIGYLQRPGISLLKEKPGSLQFRPVADGADSAYRIAQAFILEDGEAIYGLGQHQRGNLNQRNQKYRLLQGNTEDAIPFFQSIKGYGVFWDNYSPTNFEDIPGETMLRSDVGDCVDYYFMYGGSADSVIAAMRELTGRAPLFPLWTFGYWQSKERYKSQDELVGVVKNYRQLGVPLDGIIQDWQYWGGNYLWNAMEFLNPDFYDPPKMVRDIHALNAHAIISIWSSFGPMTKPYRALQKQGMLLDFVTWPESGSEKWPPNPDYPSGVKVYDAYHPAAREIYWKYLSEGLFSLGLDGWWMDSSEPDHLREQPGDLNQRTFLGSFRKVRNAYPLMSVGGVYDHQRKATSDKRVFILTRSAFAGQQRYGANTWSGDIVASWETLKKQIPTGLNFSLSGIPYWNSDIGGFFLWNFKKKLEDPEYRELYARWLAFGAFCPMMRSHGADAPREIYQFGKRGTPVFDAIEKFINLRYRLLPYIYSTSWDVTAHHGSMMRALMMDFPADKKTWDINSQYLFGRSILVVPVTDPQYVTKNISGRDTTWTADFSTVRSTPVYLPASIDWYDFWTGKKYKGGQQVSKETSLDIIPVYVKAGSILPIGPQVQYAGEKKWDTLEVRIYPGAHGGFTLYEDENDNYNYEKGSFSTIPFTWNDTQLSITIGERKGSFSGMLMKRTFRFVLVNEGQGQGMQPTAVSRIVDYTGKKITTGLNRPAGPGAQLKKESGLKKGARSSKIPQKLSRSNIPK